ncbi:MAG: sulfatase-like hydrolase/transferase [Planctomycetia bacterium]
MADRSVYFLSRRLASALALLALWGCGEPSRPQALPPAPSYGPGGEPVLAPGPGPRPDLLLLVLPELRADHMVAEAMPRLATLDCGGGSSRIEHATTPSPEPGTALASLLTGYLPERHGVSHLDPLPRLAPAFPTLGEILRRAGGYATRAFVADARLARAATLWQGFDVSGEVGLPEAAAAVSGWVAALGEPGARPPFAAVLVADALGPGYGAVAREAPRPAARPFLRAQQARDLAQATPAQRLAAAREDYVAALRWADAQVGQLLDRLAPAPGGRPLWVLVTSTSGTALGERGRVGTGLDLHDEQVRVPWLWAGPPGLRSVASAASVVDVLPTLLEALRLAPLAGADGVALGEVLAGRATRAPVRSIELVDAANTGEATQRAQLYLARMPGWSYMVRLDLREGTVREAAHDLVADAAQARDLAREGRVAGVAFPPAFCAGVEAVRDLVWGAAEGHNRLAGSAYDQGPRVLQGRPAPCTR